jgi:hypothetical protein
MNGEVLVTAVGTGFPLGDSDSSQLIVSTNNAAIIGSITVRSVSLCEAQFTFPAQASSLPTTTTTLTYALRYPSYSYTLNSNINIILNPSLDPSVTALSIQSASPILKQNIVVTGTNFDLDASNMRAYLYFQSNNTLKYELGVLSVATSTSMTCVLGGGRTGDYFLRVLVVGKGMSAPSAASRLSYEIVVNSVSPSSGTIGGGYALTVNGANFATATGSTQVFIGDGFGGLCSIISINSTQINCTVPVMD